MKTKNLIIIFILFLLITLGSGLVVFFTKEKEQPVLNEAGRIINFSNQPSAAEKKPVEPIKNSSLYAKPKKTAQPEITDRPTEEKIQAVMLINGVEYRTAVKLDSSVYDLMSALKEQKKIDFKGKNYSGLGFFVEEINGVKNNSTGKNWLYYINGQPGQVGVSYYLIKANDIIEWKYSPR